MLPVTVWPQTGNSTGALFGHQLGSASQMSAVPSTDHAVGSAPRVAMVAEVPPALISTVGETGRGGSS